MSVLDNHLEASLPIQEMSKSTMAQLGFVFINSRLDANKVRIFEQTWGGWKIRLIIDVEFNSARMTVWEVDRKHGKTHYWERYNFSIKTCEQFVDHLKEFIKR